MNKHQTSPTLELLPPLREVIAKFQLSTKRSLGQHFLLDTNLTDRIARIAKIEGATVIEIGPGPGGLTRSLLHQGAEKVIAVEKDQHCLTALEDLRRIYPDRLTLLKADALNLDLTHLSSSPCNIVANLPYNISTVLLINWLQHIEHVERMTLMFQKEVAERLTASPSTKEYGRLSVIVQWLCEVKPQFNVDSKAFLPPPKVASSVVTLIPRSKPVANADWQFLEKVTFAAFNQRRKMLRSSLKDFNFDFRALELDPTLRAENLTVEQFCRLARSATG